MVMMTPQTIRFLRVSLGWSPTRLAAFLEVSENTVRRWEIGDRHPRYDSSEKMNKLAEKHGISLNGKIKAAV